MALAPATRAGGSAPARPYRTWGDQMTRVNVIAAPLDMSISTLVTPPVNAVAGLAIILVGASADAHWQPPRATAA